MYLSVFLQQVEERIYPTSSWACSEQFATPVTKDSKTAESFMTILRYIQGKNELGNGLTAVTVRAIFD